MTPELLLKGFEQARERYMSTGRIAGAPDEALIPMSDALNWATTLDERFATIAGSQESKNWDWRADYPNGDVMAGFRYARNCVHHHWAEGLYLDTSGAVLPTPLPFGFFEWRWQDSLPPTKLPYGKAEYETLMACQPARFTLDALAELFSSRLTDPV